MSLGPPAFDINMNNTVRLYGAEVKVLVPAHSMGSKVAPSSQEQNEIDRATANWKQKALGIHDRPITLPFYSHRLSRDPFYRCRVSSYHASLVAKHPIRSL